MAVQQEIKSQLAKLLATEDLVVEHRQISTAQFDVHSRVLTLPMWEKASGNVYDMLVGHEVGHALYTPDEWGWRDRIPQQFVNVVEDARIEKLMKRKYLGIAKTFFRGYTELHEKNFFEVNGEDYNSFNLADRTNLYYKIGNFLDISFTDTEKEIVDLIGKCETFDDVLKASEVLYQYCKTEQEEKISLENTSKEGTDDIELNSEGRTDEGKEEESEIESPQTPQMEKSGSDMGEVQENQEIPEDIEVKTADAFEERLQSLINDEGVDNIYVELPKLNLDTVIAKNSEVHDVIDEYYVQSLVDHTSRADRYKDYGYYEVPETPYEETDKSFTQFKRDAQKEVNYLVKEFECKKAASAYARATIARTGVLDTTKLHTYRYNEDIFKKITALPDGKNHGLVFVLDWSGSMQYVLQDTLKQLYNLIWFCRKVNIPFEVYAFTNEWNRRSDHYINKQLTKHYEEAENLLVVDETFTMMNILTSKINAKTLEKQMLNIWRIAECFATRTYYRYPERLCLSGTPLNESLIALHQILPLFQKENRVEKTQCIVLTDGEGSQVPYHKMIEDCYFSPDGRSRWLGSRNIRPHSTFLRDRKVGKTYGFQYDYHEFTDVLLTNLKDRFPTTNFIGIRVLPNRDAGRFIRLYHPCGNDKLSEDWRKTKSFTIKNSGYDAYFAMSAQSLADDAEFEVKEDATKAEIKRAFAKSLKVKKLNKKVLGEFVSLVA